MPKKTCSTCKIIKELTDFHQSKSHSDGKTYSCKECSKLKAKKHRQKYKELYKLKDFAKNLRNSFGITVEEYEKLLSEQGSKCKICLKKEDVKNTKTKEIQHLSVDHDHKTGKVRGLLCTRCNRGLGYFKDDILLLQEATKYLSN